MKTDNSTGPIVPKSALAKIQAILIPITDELYYDGAESVALEMLPDYCYGPTAMGFKIAVDDGEDASYLEDEYVALANRLSSIGCSIDQDEFATAFKGRIYISARISVHDLDGVHVFGTRPTTVGAAANENQKW